MSHLRDDLLEEGAFVKVKDWLNADQAAQQVLPGVLFLGLSLRMDRLVQILNLNLQCKSTS